jgi:diguanylate cyclase (GGDEF)-like protein
MNLRVLLVETAAEDAAFLRDALAEIADGRFWDTWMPIETVHAATLAEACTAAANDLFDVILLNCDLPDSRGIETFRRIHGAAAHIPIVLLIAPGEWSLALKMIREGAQDFLVRGEIDCAPLAHAIRASLERHRLITATRAASVVDSLTGLPNRGGFFAFADRDRRLADRLGRRLLIVIAEPKNLGELSLAFGDQRRDLALVEAADRLRAIAGSIDVVARIGEQRFAIAVLETGAESLEQAWIRIHAAAEAHRIAVGRAIFDAHRPVSLETLLEQAELTLAPQAPARA